MPATIDSLRSDIDKTYFGHVCNHLIPPSQINCIVVIDNSLDFAAETLKFCDEQTSTKTWEAMFATGKFAFISPYPPAIKMPAACLKKIGDYYKQDEVSCLYVPPAYFIQFTGRRWE
jgi:hypothetical protein